LLAMQVMLEDLGENLVTARSGCDALRCLLDQDFAVILLDVNMPDMDGFETASLIRQRNKSAHTPIIFLTAYSDEIHTARGYSLGAVDYILAPVLPEVLRTKVKVFVDLFKMTEQVKRQAEERIALERAQTARAAAEETTRRTAFLAEASKALTSSLDYEATLRGLTRLLVPYLADLSIICLVDEHGQLTQTQLVWPGSGSELSVHTIARSEDLSENLAAAIRRMLVCKGPEMVTDVDQWFPKHSTTDAPRVRPDFVIDSGVCVRLEA